MGELRVFADRGRAFGVSVDVILHNTIGGFRSNIFLYFNESCDSVPMYMPVDNKK